MTNLINGVMRKINWKLEIDMNKELEIRAAKCLGAIALKSSDGSKQAGFKFPETFEFGVIQHTEWLKFTTSYDWAMLLVKECQKKGYCVDLRYMPEDEYQGVKIYGYCIFVYAFNNPVENRAEIYYQGNETEPHMICWALVPVLEEIK